MGRGFHALLQGITPTQGSDPSSLTLPMFTGSLLVPMFTSAIWEATYYFTHVLNKGSPHICINKKNDLHSQITGIHAETQIKENEKPFNTR